MIQETSATGLGPFMSETGTLDEQPNVPGLSAGDIEQNSKDGIAKRPTGLDTVCKACIAALQNQTGDIIHIGSFRISSGLFSPD
jgi:hypothetical protein